MALPPLAGRRVLVTRAAHQAGKLRQALAALGAEAVEVPVLEIRPPQSFAPLDAALANLKSYDWLILTSANTVRAMAARAVELGLKWALPPDCKVAAVGRSTAEAARDHGLQITIVPESYVAESLAQALEGQAAHQTILLARAAVARDVIPDALRAAGARVTVVDAYRNVLPDGAPALLRQALARGVDAATFTSSSSVTHLERAAQAAGVAWPLEDVAAISIGPVTSRTLRERGWEPATEAGVSDIAGLVAAVKAYFEINFRAN